MISVVHHAVYNPASPLRLDTFHAMVLPSKPVPVMILVDQVILGLSATCTVSTYGVFDNISTPSKWKAIRTMYGIRLW